MLKRQQKEVPPVKAVLKVSMIVDGEPEEKGEVVELSVKEFRYLLNHDRVAEATKENVEAVQAEVKAEKARADKAEKAANELDTAKAEIARLKAELEKAKK